MYGALIAMGKASIAALALDAMSHMIEATLREMIGDKMQNALPIPANFIQT